MQTTPYFKETIKIYISKSLQIMKHLFGYASVFALAAGFSLSSCSSDDDAADFNPGIENNGEAVKTQFSISIPHGQRNSRMTENETQSQDTPEFQGMRDIKVLTFKKAGAANPLTGDETAFGAFGLRPIGAGVAGGDGLSATSQAKVYNDVSIDPGVNHMVFYGASAYAHQEGVLNTNVNQLGNAPLPQIEFNLAPRAAAGLNTSAHGQAILNHLNAVMAVANFDQERVDDAENPFYEVFTSLKSLTIASGHHLFAVMQDMHKTVEAITVEGGLTNQTALKTALLEKLKGELFEASGVDDKDLTNLAWVSGKDATVATFPADLKLPEGVAKVECPVKTFAFVDQDINNITLAASKVTYPAALYYFGNSTLATSDVTYKEALLGATAWDDLIKQLYSGGNALADNGVVSASTRSISMVKPVNYGVALLKTGVKLSTSTILDQKGAPVVNVTGNYPVTGVLIGGQKPVNWSFNQKSVADEASLTIYDGTWSGQAASTAPVTQYNPTLALESKKDLESTGAVYIAVEFENTGNDFYGVGGQLVKKGMKFYLTAKLDPTKYNTKNGATSVLQQDYVTTATLTISSLANAHIVIPDLRPSQMEFGMSVDLKWEQGFVFNQDFE